MAFRKEVAADSKVDGLYKKYPGLGEVYPQSKVFRLADCLTEVSMPMMDTSVRRIWKGNDGCYLLDKDGYDITKVGRGRWCTKRRRETIRQALQRIPSLPRVEHVFCIVRGVAHFYTFPKDRSWLGLDG